MGADHVVHLSCQPKLALGRGDISKGTELIIEKLKAQNRAAMIAENAKQKGKPLDKIKIRMRKMTANGEVAVQVGYAELMAEAEGLAPHREACRTCPANVLGEPFGCIGYLNYPIAGDAETWLIHQVQRADTLGGFLCLQALHDFKYDGAPIRKMREMALFDLPTGITRDIGLGTPEGTRIIGSDQILQALLGAGDKLDPWHCGLVLLWLGALKVNGKVPGGKDDMGPLDAMRKAATPAERERIAAFDIGGRRQVAAGLQDMCRAMYRAWVLQVPLRVWAK